MRKGKNLPRETIESCPPEEVWDRVALGLDDPEDSADLESLLEHAAQCVECAPRLREAAIVFGEDEMPGEAEWVAEATRETTDRPALVRERPATRFRLMAIAATALIAVAGGLSWKLFVADRSASGALETLAAAYAAERSTDLRLPGAPHGPLRLSRAGGSAPRVPLGAQEEAPWIERRYRESSTEAAWAHAQARLRLLQGEPGAAADLLEGARDLAAPDAALLAELGVAYVLRGDLTQSSGDYMLALESFGEALRLDPGHRASLFNKALALERLGLESQAIAAWDELLEVEESPDWREEAEQYRAKLIESAAWLASPEREAIAAQYDEVVLSRRLERAEELERWLESEDARVLAVTLLASHRDPWLRDLIRAGSMPEMSTLSESAARRSTISAHAYGDLPERLRWLQLERLPAPWRAWVEFELLYYRSHTTPGDGCGGPSLPAVSVARQHGYRWLEAQSWLEASTCRVASGNEFGAAQAVSEALSILQSSEFPVAHTRALGFKASHLVNQGWYREALVIVREQLGAVRANNIPPIRLQQYLEETRRISDRLDRPHTALAAALEAAELSRLVGAVAQEMILRSMAAGYARQAGGRQQSAGLYQSASTLAEAMREQRLGPAYAGIASLTLALSRNDREALQDLTDVSRGIRNAFWSVPHLTALAELQLEASDLAAAEETVDELIAWLTGETQGALRPSGRPWRQALERAFTLKTEIALEAGDEIGALANWRRYRCLDGGVLGFDLDAVGDCPGIRPPAGAVRMTLARLRDRYASWVQTADAVEFRWLSESADSIDRQSRSLRRLCSAPGAPVRMIEEQARILADSLLAPAADRLLAAARVELELSGDVDSAPIHVLPVQGIGPLGLARSVVYVLSPRSWPGDAEEYDEALVVAASALAPDRRSRYPYLPRLDQEARTIAGNFKRSTVLSGDAATSLGIASALHGQAVFHYAGHSYYRGDRAVLSLAPGGEADSDEFDVSILRGKAPRLAFLAACSTANGSIPDTIAPRGVSHAFLREGAQFTISAMWDLDTVVASDVAERFYGHLSAGKTLAESLRQASDSVRLSGYSHPYYWAPFVLSI